jgi:hypothetical protein
MILMSFLLLQSRSVTLICDSIAKHIKSLKRYTLQPFPGADIWDIVYYLDARIAKVNHHSSSRPSIE